MEAADADFGQPHVATTSIVPEPTHAERRAAEAAAELAKQEKQESFNDPGGCSQGTGWYSGTQMKVRQ